MDTKSLLVPEKPFDLDDERVQESHRYFYDQLAKKMFVEEPGMVAAAQAVSTMPILLAVTPLNEEEARRLETIDIAHLPTPLRAFLQARVCGSHMLGERTVVAVIEKNLTDLEKLRAAFSEIQHIIAKNAPDKHLASETWTEQMNRSRVFEEQTRFFIKQLFSTAP